jgi:hypothetical protein
MNTIMVNGVAMDLDSFEGPSGEELYRAQKRHNSARAAASPHVSNGGEGSRGGVPVKEMKYGMTIGGVRVK